MRKKKTKKGKNQRTSSISACMIVKNEEEFLPQCLESIKDFVEEIIIVDTGSTDKTVKIAKEYGSRVFHHPWEGDFSKHRNQSIRYASGDWVFVLDADEEVVQWDRHVDTIIRNSKIDSIYVRIENIFGQGQGTAWHHAMRLFRNNGTITYRGRVHEQLVGWKKSAPSAIAIYHKGYCLDRENEERKSLRNETLLKQVLEEDADNPEAHHYLAVAYLSKRLFDKALAECEKALTLASRRDHDEVFYLWTRFVGAVSCLNTNRLDEAERLCVEAVKTNPMHVDSHYVLSSLYYSQDKIQQFLEHSDRYLSLLKRVKHNPGDFGLMVHNTIRHEWRIRLHRAFAFTKRGEAGKADKEYALSLRVCHDRSEYYKERCLFCLRRSEYGRAQRFLKSALKHNPVGEELQRLKFELSKKMKGDGRGRKRGEMSGARGKKTASPTISLCMIVKDEEKSLPQCLESARDYVDEIIVVDTGSTDKTVKIAESYGAKVYLHPWEGDFSRHRNQSISYATKHWILILDADEFLLPECGKIVREAIQDEAIDSVYAVVKNPFDKGRGEAVHNSIRIFRNNGAIHYEGRVHNRVVGEEASKVYPITILHEGYNLPPEQSHKKFLRTTKLLKQEIQENPRHPRAYHYLAASYLSEQMYDEAIGAATKAITLAEENNFDDFLYLWSHFIAGISYLKTDKLDEAEAACLSAVNKSPRHLDSHYLLTIIYFHKKNWKRLFHHSDEYLALVEKIQKTPGEFGPMVHNTINHEWRVHLHRGFALVETGKKESAREAFSRALNHCDDKGEYYRLLAVFTMRRSEFSKAEKHLLKALKFNPDDEELYRNGAQIYQKLGKREQEKIFLKEVVKRDSDDIDTAFHLGTIYLQENRDAEAVGLLKKVIAKDPRHSAALINLGILAKRSGDLDSALRYLERAVQQTPDSVEALSNLGYLYYHRDNLQQAREIFDHLTHIDPTLVDIHLMLSLVYVNLKSPELVVGECDKLLGLVGLNRDITLNSLSDLSNLFIDIGKALLEQRRPALASLAFKVAMHLGGESIQTLKRIGRICFQQGDYNACLEYLEKAIRLSPRDWENFYLMGDCYTRIGVEEAATICHQKAKELNPYCSSLGCFPVD